ncbi:MAG: hypothetical protein WAU83_00745, partial [Pseudonocardiaceae bacterium]
SLQRLYTCVLLQASMHVRCHTPTLTVATSPSRPRGRTPGALLTLLVATPSKVTNKNNRT